MTQFDSPAGSPVAAGRVGGSDNSDIPLRLLHVEDNPADALLMQEYIRQSSREWNVSLPTSSSDLPMGYTSVEFDLAERLADLTPARAGAADCAILDLSLPDASDLQALVALRAMSLDLPIIVLTGFDDLETGLSALQYGADDYLVKGQVDGFTLDRAVRYAIARRRLTRDVAAAAVATTADSVAVIMSAALQAEVRRARYETPVGLSRRDPAPNAAPGTHHVLVQIDESNLEYALRCHTCSWEADRGSEDLHSWGDRSLEWMLLRHVAFGELPDAASAREHAPARVTDIEAASEAARERVDVRRTRRGEL